MRDEAINAAVTAGNKLTVSGVVTSIAGAAINSGPTFWVGAFIGLVGLLVNWYYKHKEDRRREAVHQRLMASPIPGETLETD